MTGSRSDERLILKSGAHLAHSLSQRISIHAAVPWQRTDGPQVRLALSESEYLRKSGTQFAHRIEVKVLQLPNSRLGLSRWRGGRYRVGRAEVRGFLAKIVPTESHGR